MRLVYQAVRTSLTLKHSRNTVLGLTLLLTSVKIAVSPAFAATITLTKESDGTISDYSQELQVKADLSINSSDGTVYHLRGVFYKENTAKYCGSTWNGSDWYSGPFTTGEGWKNLPQITVSSSSATTVIKAKLDATDHDCQSPGRYNFKIQRFTAGGSGSFDDQNPLSLTVNVEPPSQTPTPTPKPTVTPKPSATPKPAASASSPTSRPTQKPSSVLASTLSVTSTVPEFGVTSSGLVLGSEIKEQIFTSEESTGSSQNDEENQLIVQGTNQNRAVPFIIIGVGMLFLAAAGTLFIIKARQTS